LKVVPQCDQVKEVTAISGRTYRVRRDGYFHMSEADAKHTVKWQGGQQPAMSGITSRRIGYRCANCGFGSFVKVCSRCGGECAREA
jgi:hypothetical protein